MSNNPRQFTNPIFAQPEGGLPPIVANAIGQRFANPPPPANPPLTAAQRAELARLEVVTPMMENIRIGREQPMIVNPLVRARYNTNQIAERPETPYRPELSIAPVRATSPNIFEPDYYQFWRRPRYTEETRPRPIVTMTPTSTPSMSRETSRRGSSRLLESRRLFQDPQPPAGQSTNPRSRFSFRRNNPPQ